MADSKMDPSSFADSRVSPQLYKTVNDIIHGKGGSLTKWNKVMKELWAANIPYKSKLTAWDILVHQENRGGLGLNAYQVHEILRTIKEIGADLEAVHRATCFEMPPPGPKRDALVAFNASLIERAAGILAKLKGSERFASVACSHFAAGCRAADASCDTPEEKLQDANKKINLIQLCENDEVFLSLVKEGWVWTILPYWVQELWPELPDLAQDALNAEHATFSMASELQVMMSMAKRSGGSSDIDWSKIKADIKASQPPCVDYLDDLCEFVRLYAGGHGAPIVRYLEGFAKEYGGSQKLG